MVISEAFRVNVDVHYPLLSLSLCILAHHVGPGVNCPSHVLVKTDSTECLKILLICLVGLSVSFVCQRGNVLSPSLTKQEVFLTTCYFLGGLTEALCVSGKCSGASLRVI